MRLTPLVLALAIAAAPAAHAATSIENWPTKYTFGDGTEVGLTGNYAYDDNNFSGDDRLEDLRAQAHRQRHAHARRDFAARRGCWQARRI